MSPPWAFFQNQNNGCAWKAKGFAMFKGTTILAMGCILGMVLAAGPAAAKLTRWTRQ
jgi:hypothetical protein